MWQLIGARALYFGDGEGGGVGASKYCDTEMGGVGGGRGGDGKENVSD